MPSIKAFVIIAALLISLASCVEDERKLVKRDIIMEAEVCISAVRISWSVRFQYVPNDENTAKGGLHQGKRIQMFLSIFNKIVVT